MRKHHPENERTKRRYFEFLKHAKQLSESSIDQVAAAIADFEAATGLSRFSPVSHRTGAKIQTPT